jgi:hypothetical protein
MRTYVVRLAELAPSPQPTSATGPAAPRLCGVVDDVQSGERTPFRGATELLDLLAGAPGEEGALVDSPGDPSTSGP